MKKMIALIMSFLAPLLVSGGIEAQTTPYKTILHYSQEDTFYETSLATKADKEQFLMQKNQIFTSNKGESTMSRMKSLNTSNRLLRYVKIGGVKGPLNPDGTPGLCSGDNGISVSDPLWGPIWQAAANQDLFWYKDNQLVLNLYNDWCYTDITSTTPAPTNPTTTKKQLWINATINHVKSLTNNNYISGVFLDNAQIPVPGYASVNMETDIPLAKQYYAGLRDIIKQLDTYFKTANLGYEPYIMINAYNSRNELYKPAQNLDLRGMELLEDGADGMMREYISFDYKNEPYERERFVRNLLDFHNIVNGTVPGHEAMGPKDVVMLDDLALTSDTEKRLLSLAGYLVVANNDKGKAYHYLFPRDIPSGEVTHLPEENLDLGRPLGPMTIVHNGMRYSVADFMNKVFVNSDQIYIERTYEKGVVVLVPGNSTDRPKPPSVNYNLGGQAEKLVLTGGGAFKTGGNGGTLNWVAISGTTYSMPAHTALIFRLSGRAPIPAPDELPPTVTMTSPTNESIKSAAVSISASASDNVGVSTVSFFVDNVLKGVVSTAPYSYIWNTTANDNGIHQIYAKATDAAGNTTDSASVQVTINNTTRDPIPPPDATAPTVELTSPSNGSSLSGSVSVTATASDNVGVTNVEFLLDGNVFAYDSGTTHSASLDTTTLPDGLHTLSAKAYDAVGNVGTSAGIQINVDNIIELPPVDTVPPTDVRITNPTTTKIRGSISVQVYAVDNQINNMDKVKIDIYPWDYKKNVWASNYISSNSVLATVESNGNQSTYFKWIWDTKSSKYPKNRKYKIVARAYDKAGNRTDVEMIVTVVR